MAEARRLAVVTGASSGIGEAYAERLAVDGWDLLVVARRKERLDALATRLHGGRGVDVHVLAADLADRGDLHAARERIRALPVGLLVNNAALAHYMPFAELPEERAEELVHLNVEAPVLLTRAVLPGMRERGRGAIVNVASMLAFSGDAGSLNMAGRAVYASSKAFLVTFTQLLASELEGSGVQLQVVCPGMVRSEFHSRQGIDASRAPRLEAGDVVRASLRGLELGETICIPTLEETAAIAGVSSAQRELMGAAWSRGTEIASRYRD